MVYVLCVCLLGGYFTKFGIVISGFSSMIKELKLYKLGVIWANYSKKHTIWTKLGAFLSKMVYWWVDNCAKNWYRESQIFKVQQAHPYTILAKVSPARGVTGKFFWGAKSFFLIFFPGVKCFSPVENFHFCSPKTNFCRFGKWKERKKKRKKEKKSPLLIFKLFPPSIFNFPPSL